MQIRCRFDAYYDIFVGICISYLTYYLNIGNHIVVVVEVEKQLLMDAVVVLGLVQL